MRLPAGLVGNAVDVGEMGIGKMVDRGQDDPPLHPLDGQGVLDGRGGPEGMPDLGLVGGDRDLLQLPTEDLSQALDLDLVSLRRGGAVGVDVLDVGGLKPCVVDRLPDPPGDRYGVRLGEMVGVGGPADPHHLGPSREAVTGQHLLGGEHHDAGPLGKDEAAPVDAEGAGGPGGIRKARSPGRTLMVAFMLANPWMISGRIGVSTPPARTKSQSPSRIMRAPMPMAWLPEAQAPWGEKTRSREPEQHPRLSRGEIGAEVGQEVGADLQGTVLLERRWPSGTHRRR